MLKFTLTFVGLIVKAILSTKDLRMVPSEIYEWIEGNYAYFRNRGPSWMKSVRYNLTTYSCFIKVGEFP